MDHEEELLRDREAELCKKREEREAQFQAKLKVLEAEEEARGQEEERYQARLRALNVRTVESPTPPIEYAPPLAPKAFTPTGSTTLPSKFNGLHLLPQSHLFLQLHLPLLCND